MRYQIIAAAGAPAVENARALLARDRIEVWPHLCDCSAVCRLPLGAKHVEQVATWRLARIDQIDATQPPWTGWLPHHDKPVWMNGL